jgi:hypothetical protein
MRLMMNSRRARPTPCVGNLGEVEGAVGVADVHHDLQRRLGMSSSESAHAEFQLAVVDVAGVAFGAGHRHRIAVDESLGGVAAADHRRECPVRGR